MSNLELIEVTLDATGFAFYIVGLPEDDVGDKLVRASTETGLVCRMEYQDFLFAEFVVNLERVFHYIAEVTGGDPNGQIEMRNLIEEEVYKVNPVFDPRGLVISKNGIIKVAGKGEGTPLVENSDWDRIFDSEDINPFIPFEEIKATEGPNETDDLKDLLSDDDLDSMGQVNTVERKWSRVNVVLNIRKFSRNDLPIIFGSVASFSKPLHYKIHIIQRCVEKANEVFALCDAMGMTAEVQIPVLAEELYQICIEVNPFLEAEEVDLSALKLPHSRTASKSRRGPHTKRKGHTRAFSDVSREELLSLGGRIKTKVVGQEDAIDRLVDTIQIASCGLRDSESPIASYLMCGTTGIGKTLVAKVLAEELCGSRDNLVRIDCSEYTQPHDIQKLIGAQPSYVGYEDGGFLTNAVQDNPFSVVLFDEIEKAHSKLFDLLLQVMDDARLTDGKGRVTSFKDCILLMTSNIGVSESEDVKSTMGFGDAGLLTEERRAGALKKALKARFRPEFINRIDDTLSFRSLLREDAIGVVRLLLDKVKGYLVIKDISVDFTANVHEMVFQKGFSKKYGARPLQRVVDREIIRVLAKKLLAEEIKEGSRIRVDYQKDALRVRILKARKLPRKTKTALVKA